MRWTRRSETVKLKFRMRVSLSATDARFYDAVWTVEMQSRRCAKRTYFGKDVHKREIKRNDALRKSTMTMFQSSVERVYNSLTLTRSVRVYRLRETF